MLCLSIVRIWVFCLSKASSFSSEQFVKFRRYLSLFRQLLTNIERKFPELNRISAKEISSYLGGDLARISGAVLLAMSISLTAFNQIAFSRKHQRLFGFFSQS